MFWNKQIKSGGANDLWRKLCERMSMHYKSEAELEGRLLDCLDLIFGWGSHHVLRQAPIKYGHETKRADILLHNGDDALIAIELKRQGVKIDDESKGQLFSYMRQLKVDFGILIGDNLALYYDDPSDGKAPKMVMKIDFNDNGNSDGNELAKLLRCGTFDKNALRRFALERVKRSEESKKIEEAERLKQWQEYSGNAFSSKKAMMSPARREISTTRTEDDVVFREPVLLISIGRTYPYVKNAEHLYNATRWCWKLKLETVQNYSVVCATYKGKIVETYIVDDWRVVGLGSLNPDYGGGEFSGKTADPDRNYFVGRVADEGRRKMYNGKMAKYLRKRGVVSPIYVGKKLSDGTYVSSGIEESL